MNNIIFNLILRSVQLTALYLFIYLFIYTSMWKIEKIQKKLIITFYIYFILFCNRLAITESN